MMSLTMRLPSRRSSTCFSSSEMRMRSVPPAVFLRFTGPELGPESKSTSSTSSPPTTTISAPVDFRRNTMADERMRFSMIGHSSIIRAPSIRIDSALIGTTLSRSYSIVVSCEKWYSPSFHRKRR